MDIGTALSKIRTALEWLVRERPAFTGKYLIEIRFRRGRIIALKKIARDMIL